MRKPSKMHERLLEAVRARAEHRLTFKVMDGGDRIVPTRAELAREAARERKALRAAAEISAGPAARARGRSLVRSVEAAKASATQKPGPAAAARILRAQQGVVRDPAAPKAPLTVSRAFADRVKRSGRELPPGTVVFDVAKPVAKRGRGGHPRSGRGPAEGGE